MASSILFEMGTLVLFLKSPTLPLNTCKYGDMRLLSYVDSNFLFIPIQISFTKKSLQLKEQSCARKKNLLNYQEALFGGLSHLKTTQKLNRLFNAYLLIY
jgi:hypothetical protein